MKRQIYSAAIDVQLLNEGIKNNRTTKRITLGSFIAYVMGAVGVIGIIYFQWIGRINRFSLLSHPFKSFLLTC